MANRHPASAELRRLRRDLAAARRQLAALRWQADHDPLTRLLNRDGFAAAWPVTGLVALLDLDAFKPINDTFGHAAGDEVLIAVAARLHAHATLAGRLGGDEFVVVIPDPATAHRIAAAVAADITLTGGAVVSVTASIGLAPAVGRYSDVLGHADAAMYRAKAGAAVAVYDPRLDDRTSPAADPRPAVRLRDLPVTETPTLDHTRRAA